METKKRAATYIRVSSKEQATDDKASLEVQQRECEAYCSRKGYEVARCPYVDIQSGTDSRKERASFEQMLGDARKGTIDVIVAWRPDRLFRSLWPAARLKQVMDATGVDVETVTQPMDKSTLGLWDWVAEREIENIRERTLMGRESMARAGKFVNGNPAYGFRYDKSIKQLRQRLDSLHISDHNLEDASRLCLLVRDRMAGLTPQKQKEFLRLVVDRIWVDGSNNLEIDVIIPQLDKVSDREANCEIPLSFG